MNVLENIQLYIRSHIQKLYTIPEHLLSKIEVTINTDEKKTEFGDLTTNAALIIAQERKSSPRSVAQEIISDLVHPYFQKIDIAGPGFINIFLAAHVFKQLMQELYHQDKDFFTSQLKNPHTYSLEYVSANPTGPLHLGHGRGAIIGDVLARVLTLLGHKVIREYYINDAGSQIAKLGLSLKARCMQGLGIEVSFPEDGYQGEYLIKLAQTCIKEYGKDVVEKSHLFFEEYAKGHLLAVIKKTLHDYGVEFDVWFSEKTLHTTGVIQR